mmetsp:Transcript_41266/g.64491  ORF Transcript_41266/g.64491 Transcript_41266/m.64491 type:complete len:246 (+) Transcript_41266:114-851(+)|eukprot:CAMPEP_0184319434 /NCGR_PEP_ID=MMETSP1049-20130417/108505_1 /TAXON_ID=77928 /ORGANISM="Proteomonas sulcata, Strain CCMP704" /LENGTH=245 /DNA_ID=CAMNT_0026639573 /DNA_START=94 /DNA_END=831 /DNA_ORIENTATION=+
MAAVAALTRRAVRGSASRHISVAGLQGMWPSAPQLRGLSTAKDTDKPSIKRQQFASGTKPEAENLLKPVLKWLGFYSEESKMIRSSHRLYLAARSQARKPEFRKHFGMEESFENEFCLESLHVWMILVRLRREGAECKQLQQDVFDNFWDDKQKQMFSMGVQSFALNTRTRELQSIFYGIAVSFDYGLGSSDALLGSAMYRNLFVGEARAVHVNQMVAYVRRELQKLDDMDKALFLSGQWQFGNP